MTKRYLAALFWLVCCTFELSAQPYFQQRADMTIRVRLDDSLHMLNAWEKIHYVNYSPDTLRYILFHLWPNGYSSNSTMLAKEQFRGEGKKVLFDDPDRRGYIDSLDFLAGTCHLRWESYEGQPDICRVYLAIPLAPGDSVDITTPFRVKIPLGVTSRLGHIGESYQITQWYPKPAVYDRNGWNAFPYLNQGEFYSEYGRYEVSITLPSNYVVGATGNLQDRDEQRWLNRLAGETSGIEQFDSLQLGFPESSFRLKTLHYIAPDVHDFAWFADKRFHVLKGSVILPGSGKKVNTWVMFTNGEASKWIKAISYVNDAIRYYSKWIGDYRYDNCTAVESALSAGAGMEYPGITVIGSAPNDIMLEDVIMHEVGHNWFYSVLGSNERRFPFMDEGINTFYEMRYFETKYPTLKMYQALFDNERLARFLKIEELPMRSMQEYAFLFTARENLEQPLNLAAPDYSRLNYGTMIYFKTGICFYYLRSYLGDSLFDSTMQDYYRKWSFKHPQPEDIHAVFSTHVSTDLSWFFSDLLGTTKKLDYSLERIRKGKVLIRNRGQMVSPLVLAGMQGDSVHFQKWVEGFSHRQWVQLPSLSYTELKIDPLHVMPELYRMNNNLRHRRLFPKADPLQIQLLATIENPEKQTIMVLPVPGYNAYNGFMAGLILHNGFIIRKKIEYALIPQYGFRDKHFAGTGRLLLNFTPYSELIRLATVSLEGRQYGANGDKDYRRVSAGLNICFREKTMNSQIRHRVFLYGLAVSDISAILQGKPSPMKYHALAGYDLQKVGRLDPWKLHTVVESGRGYARISTEFIWQVQYAGGHSGLDFRAFAGTMAGSFPAHPEYGFAAGSRNGRELYLYDGIYADRFSSAGNSILSRQVSLTDGGLISPQNDSIGYGRSVASLCIAAGFPGKAGKIPLKGFVSAALLDRAGYSADPFFFEAGIKTGVWKFLEIYIPLVTSGNISAFNPSVKSRIRFVFNLSTLDPLRIREKLINEF